MAYVRRRCALKKRQTTSTVNRKQCNIFYVQIWGLSKVKLRFTCSKSKAGSGYYQSSKKEVCEKRNNENEPHFQSFQDFLSQSKRTCEISVRFKISWDWHFIYFIFCVDHILKYNTFFRDMPFHLTPLPPHGSMLF